MALKVLVYGLEFPNPSKFVLTTVIGIIDKHDNALDTADVNKPIFTGIFSSSG